MKLLVSVRSAAEVAPALAGGADIIDAKEPGHGSLGPGEPRCVGGDCCRSSGTLLAQRGAGRLQDRRMKLALSFPRGAASEAGATVPESGLSRSRRTSASTQHPELGDDTAARSSATPAVIAVAYADAARVAAIDPWLLVELAAKAGATGILLDTYTKGSGSLLTWFTPEELMRWVASARAPGCLPQWQGV